MVELKDPHGPLLQSLLPGNPIRVFDGFLGSLVVVVVVGEDVKVEALCDVAQVGKVFFPRQSLHLSSFFLWLFCEPLKVYVVKFFAFVSSIAPFLPFNILCLQETHVSTSSKEIIDGYVFVFPSGVTDKDREFKETNNDIGNGKGKGKGQGKWNIDEADRTIGHAIPRRRSRVQPTSLRRKPRFRTYQQ